MSTEQMASLHDKFVTIASDWHLSMGWQTWLLGRCGDHELTEWIEKDGAATKDVEERIIRLSFIHQHASEKWLKTHDGEFESETPMDTMLRGGMPGILRVYEYVAEHFPAPDIASKRRWHRRLIDAVFP